MNCCLMEINCDTFVLESRLKPICVQFLYQITFVQSFVLELEFIVLKLCSMYRLEAENEKKELLEGS
jgi:hypothetical protein